MSDIVQKLCGFCQTLRHDDIPAGRKRIAQRFIAGFPGVRRTSPVRDERTRASCRTISFAPPGLVCDLESAAWSLDIFCPSREAGNRWQAIDLRAESPQYDSLGCSEHRERRPRKRIRRLRARPERPEQSPHSHPVSRPYRAERIVWASLPEATRLAIHPRLSHRGPSALQIIQSPVPAINRWAIVGRSYGTNARGPSTLNHQPSTIN
jgi:hypothetical protein